MLPMWIQTLLHYCNGLDQWIIARFCVQLLCYSTHTDQLPILKTQHVSQCLSLRVKEYQFVVSYLGLACTCVCMLFISTLYTY